MSEHLEWTSLERGRFESSEQRSLAWCRMPEMKFTSRSHVHITRKWFLPMECNRDDDRVPARKELGNRSALEWFEKDMTTSSLLNRQTFQNSMTHSVNRDLSWFRFLECSLAQQIRDKQRMLCTYTERCHQHRDWSKEEYGSTQREKSPKNNIPKQKMRRIVLWCSFAVRTSIYGRLELEEMSYTW